MRLTVRNDPLCPGALEELPWPCEWPTSPRGRPRVFNARRTCTHRSVGPVGHTWTCLLLKVSSSSTYTLTKAIDRKTLDTHLKTLLPSVLPSSPTPAKILSLSHFFSLVFFLELLRLSFFRVFSRKTVRRTVMFRSEFLTSCRVFSCRDKKTNSKGRRCGINLNFPNTVFAISKGKSFRKRGHYSLKRRHQPLFFSQTDLKEQKMQKVNSTR